LKKKKLNDTEKKVLEAYKANTGNYYAIFDDYSDLDKVRSAVLDKNILDMKIKSV